MDAKTYLTCLDLLKKQHKHGSLGLSIRVIPQSLMAALGKKSNNSVNKTAVHRSLRRISSASINYVDNLGREWTRPLFYFYYQPDDVGGSYLINFNKSMIEFYKTYEYTRLHGRLFAARIGTDGLRMQMFLHSHKDKHFDRLDFHGWMYFLGKPADEMDGSPAGKKLTRQHKKKFSELINKQIQAGLLTSDSGLKRGGKVCLAVTPL